MGIWIRSQDKESLDYINKLEVQGILVIGNNLFIGQYETKERAFEVLNDIHNFIMNRQQVTTVNQGTNTTYSFETNQVYEMPKE